MEPGASPRECQALGVLSEGSFGDAELWLECHHDAHGGSGTLHE